MTSQPVPIVEDEDFLARLIDVLGEAVLRRELGAGEADAVLVLVERYRHLADNTVWACYLALDGQPVPVAAEEVAA